LFSRNIGGNERGADGPPGQGAFCKKKRFGIMFPGLAFVVNPITIRSYDDKIYNENQVIAKLKRVVHMQ
jgi:hypothetical protein